MFLRFRHVHIAAHRSERGRFPVKWTSPEGMSQGKFSAASDVWSYGIACVEIFQDGLTPYIGMSNPAVMQMVATGGVHPRPPDCTAASYQLLLSCWKMKPAERPGFDELMERFGGLHDAVVEETKAAANDPLRTRRASGMENALYAFVQTSVDFPTNGRESNGSAGESYAELEQQDEVNDTAMQAAVAASTHKMSTIRSRSSADSMGSFSVARDSDSDSGLPTGRKASYMAPVPLQSSLYNTVPEGNERVSEARLSEEEEDFAGFGSDENSTSLLWMHHS